MPDSPRHAGRLVLLHSADPDALLAHAAAPYCVRGRPEGRLPLLAVRQGGVRDEIQERAARAGCVGWLGAPVVVFAELPALLAGDLAPLTASERRALLGDLLDRAPLRHLAAARRHRGLLDAVDRFFGDLVAERVAPERLAERFALPDEWERGRDEELAALYTAYLAAVRALPPRHGVARSDGRDGRTLAAEAVRERPDDVRARLRPPFGAPDEPVTVAVYGLNDLRRGWDHLLDALRDAPFVDELRVYLALDEVEGDAARAEREDTETIGEHELLDALLLRRPDRVVRVPSRPAGDALGALRRSLFRASAAAVPHGPDAPVRALAAPDVARELEAVARRVKRLIVEEGVAPHAIAVVSRKSRPYGPRAAELLRRHGVPVTARVRTNLAEVSAVAALARVFRAAAEGFGWRALAELAESPYFDLGLDVGLLGRASARGRHHSLAGWTATLEAMAAEAALERGNDDWRGPDAERVARALASFAAFRATADGFAASRPRADWIALALRCLGRDAAGERSATEREGLWGLCRNACRPPYGDGGNLEGDHLVVEATRRDAEALAALAELLGQWRDALPLRDGAAEEPLSPGAWHAELLDALADVEITLSTPHRRGVQVLEASAAVWRSFDHLFLVGMSVGDFPAEPAWSGQAGRELFAEHEREARYAAGLPLEPAGVWLAREASLLRALVGATRRSLHVSYAYADASGAPQVPSAYFDEIVARFAAGNTDDPAPWVEEVPGSRVAPPTLDDAWCADDLQLFAARQWSSAAGRADAETALAQLASDARSRPLVERVLRAAGLERERRERRLAPPGAQGGALPAWNGAVTSPDLLAALAARFGDAVWSASQLEAYGRCPFTFFARHVLGLRSLEEPEEDMDGATRGELLHVCLERLHGGLAADLGDEALTLAALKRAPRLIEAIVPRVLDEFEKTGRGGVAALRAYRERELAGLLGAYLKWEVDENEKAQRRATPRRRPLRFELVFGMDGKPPVSLQSGGRVLKLRGKIDRVDEVTDDGARGWRYVVDHKTSDASLTPLALYEEGALLQLPLYMRALERLGEQGAGVWGGAYQIVKDESKRAAALHPRTLDKGKIREGKTKGEQDSASRLHDSVALALRHVDAAQRGEFPARLPSCVKSCPPFCDMKDVCREDRLARGGPR
ncbi:MAG: PD-(D/E)XK nuclease family protein [Gemmatimonadaceae bacterium]